MNRLVSWKDRIFPGGVRRTLQRWRLQATQRVRRADLVRLFGDLGLPAGAWICIHSRLSGLGYLVEGTASVLEAVLEAVPGCTILMPTFPFPGSALDWIRSGAVYDPRRTPSASGALSEALRLFPGAIRSLHPTHPCAAVGPDARQLIEGSENSAEPFGPHSAYGRYASASNAWQLLIHTNHTSIVHWFQERTSMPNLFLPGLHEAKGLDWDGRLHVRRVRVHRPVLPLYLAIPDYIWLPDFALAFPTATRTGLEKRLERPSAGPGPRSPAGTGKARVSSAWRDSVMLRWRPSPSRPGPIACAKKCAKASGAIGSVTHWKSSKRRGSAAN